MKIIDKRTSAGEHESEPEPQFDDFRPTLVGFEPLNDAVLLRELKLPEESAIMTPDAFAEPCLYCEVISSLGFTLGTGSNPYSAGAIVRILKGIGHTIKFSDQAEGQRYFTVNYQDIIGVWRKPINVEPRPIPKVGEVDEHTGKRRMF